MSWTAVCGVSWIAYSEKRTKDTATAVVNDGDSLSVMQTRHTDAELLPPWVLFQSRALIVRAMFVNVRQVKQFAVDAFLCRDLWCGPIRPGCDQRSTSVLVVNPEDIPQRHPES